MRIIAGNIYVDPATNLPVKIGDSFTLLYPKLYYANPGMRYAFTWAKALPWVNVVRFTDGRIELWSDIPVNDQTWGSAVTNYDAYFQWWTNRYYKSDTDKLHKIVSESSWTFCKMQVINAIAQNLFKRWGILDGILASDLLTIRGPIAYLNAVNKQPGIGSITWDILYPSEMAAAGWIVKPPEYVPPGFTGLTTWCYVCSAQPNQIIDWLSNAGLDNTAITDIPLDRLFTDVTGITTDPVQPLQQSPDVVTQPVAAVVTTPAVATTVTPGPVQNTQTVPVPAIAPTSSVPIYDVTAATISTSPVPTLIPQAPAAITTTGENATGNQSPPGTSVDSATLGQFYDPPKTTVTPLGLGEVPLQVSPQDLENVDPPKTNLTGLGEWIDSRSYDENFEFPRLVPVNNAALQTTGLPPVQPLDELITKKSASTSGSGPWIFPIGDPRWGSEYEIKPAIRNQANTGEMIPIGDPRWGSQFEELIPLWWI